MLGEHWMSVTAVTAYDAVYRKIGWLLLPVLLACYVINYLDRVSIGYAKLQFQPDLHINEAVFGLIASAFAVGYILFEVPSNLLLLRIGATWAYRNLVPAYALLGRDADARAGLARLLNDYPELTVSKVLAAMVYSQPTLERIAEGLRKAGMAE
jgi:hypothetical protein